MVAIEYSSNIEHKFEMRIEFCKRTGSRWLVLGHSFDRSPWYSHLAVGSSSLSHPTARGTGTHIAPLRKAILVKKCPIEYRFSNHKSYFMDRKLTHIDTACRLNCEAYKKLTHRTDSWDTLQCISKESRRVRDARYAMQSLFPCCQECFYHRVEVVGTQAER